MGILLVFHSNNGTFEGLLLFNGSLDIACDKIVSNKNYVIIKIMDIILKDDLAMYYTN